MPVEIIKEPAIGLERFRAQFDTEFVASTDLLDALVLESVVGPYPVYRALDRLVLLDNGRYYGSGR